MTTLRDVAEAAELHEPELGGRDSRVGVVFVDLIGSTEMAVRSEAAEVVDVLNQFFSVVVETVEAVKRRLRAAAPAGDWDSAAEAREDQTDEEQADSRTENRRSGRQPR